MIAHQFSGRGTGSFVGGLLIASFGSRVTFRIFGVAAGVLGTAYILVYLFYLRKFEKASFKSNGLFVFGNLL